MAARTNGVGLAYLECPNCGYYDAIQRRPDPSPSQIVRYTYPDGRTRNRVQSRPNTGAKGTARIGRRRSA